MGRNSFGAIVLNLIGFHRPQRVRISQGMIIQVEPPQRPNETDRARGPLELKPVFGRLAKVHISGCGSDPAPAKNIADAERPQLWKISRRFFAQGRLPVSRQHTQLRYPKEDQNETGTRVQACSCASIFHRTEKHTRSFPRVCFQIVDLALRFGSFGRAGRGCSGGFFRRASGGASGLVQDRDDIIGEIRGFARVHQNRDAVQAHARLVEDEVHIARLYFLHHHVGNFFDDPFAHAQSLLLELSLAGLTKLGDFALHVFDVRNLVVALLRFLAFGVGAEGRR